MRALVGGFILIIFSFQLKNRRWISVTPFRLSWSVHFEKIAYIVLMCLLCETLTYWSTIYELYVIKNISLGSSLKYASNGILFVAYNSHVVGKINAQSYFRSQNIDKTINHILILVAITPISCSS